MDVFSIRALPAAHGDCLFITYGDAAAPRHVMVDGGPIGAYDALRRHLLGLPGERKQLELLVVTHMDGDHIEGAIKLLNSTDPVVDVEHVWFNGWPQLVHPAIDGEAVDPPGKRSVRSPLEASFLGLRLGPWRDRWNTHVQGGPLMVPDGQPLPRFSLEGGLAITLLGPRRKMLLKLRSHWDRELTRAGGSPENETFIAERLEKAKKFRDALEMPAAPENQDLGTIARKLDCAVANGSSIAFVAEYAGRRVAMLADAHAADLQASIDRLGYEWRERKPRFDLVKLPHHGSAGNLTAELLASIECRDYLVSTNGDQFAHPDIAAIEMVIGAVPGARLHFNYCSATTSHWADAGDQAQRGYRAFYPAADAGIEVDLMRSSAPRRAAPMPT